MKRKPTFILICALAIAILGFKGAKGEDEEDINAEDKPVEDSKEEETNAEDKPVAASKEEELNTEDKPVAASKEEDSNAEDKFGAASKEEELNTEDKPAGASKEEEPNAEVAPSVEKFNFNSDVKLENPLVAKQASKSLFNTEKKLRCKYDKEMAKIESNSDGENEQNEEECKKGYLLDLKTDQLFKAIDNLEGDFESVRRNYQDAAKAEKLDSTMLQALLKFRGVGQRALHNAGGYPCQVPAGLQVGSYLVHSDDVSLYFVHRMKVRNSTIFRVTSLHNDLYNMALHVELDLNDLQITGSYEQLHADKDHYKFLYRPTFGVIDIVLSDVKYKVEGRYRLVQNRLNVEHVVSELKPKDIRVQLGNAENNPVKLFELDTIVRRIKVHLDHWMKDYFNDYLMFFGVAGKNKNADLQRYDQEKSLMLNEWMDQAITLLKAKMRHTDSTALHLKVIPMRLFAPDGMRIDVGPMVVRDIDSLHRRSVTTISAEKKGGVRQVDAMLGFGNLEVEGKYTIFVRYGKPPLEATFGVTLDGLTTHLSIVAKRGEKVPHLHFRVLEPTRTEFTTVEGSSTRYLAAYKHILETYIIALASDRMVNIIENLGDYRKCGIFTDFHQTRHVDPGQILEEGGNSEESGPDEEPRGLLYGIKRGDSVEVEVPGEKGRPSKKLHIKFSGNLDIESAKRQKRRRKLH